MPITIQEIIASDTISQLVDKTNFNFDQLLLNGGGPAGPPGIQGPIGPVGGRGPKGTTWYEDVSIVAPGANPNTTPPTLTPLIHDYYLRFNGDVWEYTGLTWSQTTINLEGPQGPTGPPGGFADAFGFSQINNKNTLYNGQIGTVGTGVTADNEGVPSILVGGIASNYDPTTSPQPTLGLTDAYLLPNALGAQLQSSVASLMIHQKDPSGTSIVFHGGNAPGNTYNYEQTTLALLSNIGIGVNDRLLLNVPKAAVGALTLMNDLVGFEVNSPTRSHSHNAGQRIAFTTGIDNLPYGVTNENSDFDVQVGQGSGTDNKFKVSTLSAGVTTDMQMGGNIALSTGQTTNAGTLQFLNGNTRFDVTSNGSGIGEFRVNAQGSIVLTTDIANTSAGSQIRLITDDGPISVNTQTGDIELRTTGGNITIEQQSSLGGTENIVIKNRSNNTSGTGGNINIEGNCAILLKSQNKNVFDAPSIALNMDGGGVPPPTPPNAPHTAFVGDQTWQGITLGSFTTPLANVSIFNNLQSAVTTSGDIFRQTGASNLTDLGQAATLDTWQGGLQTNGRNVEAGQVRIGLGDEGDQAIAPFFDSYDNSLGLSIRDTANTLEYFSANSNKTAIAGILAYKRDNELNSTQNLAPNYTSVGANPTSGPYRWGWDLSNTVPAYSFTPPNNTAMPSSADLNIGPLLIVNVGLGLGYNNSGGGGAPQQTGYLCNLNMPTGMYPGQKITVIIRNHSANFTTESKNPPYSSITHRYYGKVRIHIPRYRRQTPVGNPWTTWYNAGGFNVIGSSNFWDVETFSNDSNQSIVKELVMDLVWDGGYGTLAGQDYNLSPTDNFERSLVQFGWVVVSTNMENIAQSSGPTT